MITIPTACSVKTVLTGGVDKNHNVGGRGENQLTKADHIASF